MRTPIVPGAAHFRRPLGIAALVAAIGLTPIFLGGAGNSAADRGNGNAAASAPADGEIAQGRTAEGETAEDAPVEDETVVVDEDFETGTALPEGWTAHSGAWAVSDGQLRQTQPTGTTMLTFGEHLNDFRFEATLRYDTAANDARWVSLGLDVNPAGTAPWSQAAMRYVTTAANGLELANRLAAGGWQVPDSGPAPRALSDHQSVDVSVEVHGTTATMTFDGQQVLSGNSLQRTDNGVFGLIMDRSTVSFDRVRITELPPAPLIELVEPGRTGLVAGHRGNSQGAPENTLPSLASADAIGADFMELDLYMTADGVPIVMHDATVDRTTDGTGPVSSMTLAQIKELDAGSWFSPGFVGTSVPTFSEVLDLAEHNGGLLLPELKAGWTRDEVAVVVELIRDHGLTDRTMFQSFGVEPLVFAEELAPEIARAGLISTLPADPVAWTRQFDGAALLPSSKLVTENLMTTMHAAGIPVMTWTVDAPAEWERLTALGVDGIMSNTPGELLGWMQRYNQENAPVELAADPITVKQGRTDVDLVVTLTPSAATGTVTAVIGGRSYRADVAQGTAEIDVPRLSRGVHNVQLAYSGDDKHQAATGSTTITVTKPGR